MECRLLYISRVDEYRPIRRGYVQLREEASFSQAVEYMLWIWKAVRIKLGHGIPTVVIDRESENPIRFLSNVRSEDQGGLHCLQMGVSADSISSSCVEISESQFEASFWGANVRMRVSRLDTMRLVQLESSGTLLAAREQVTIIPHQSYKRFTPAGGILMHIRASVSVLMVAISNPSSCLMVT